MDLYDIPLMKTSGAGATCQRFSYGQPNGGRKQRKTILVMGATGAGKTTLINGMINYIFDVQWEDPFRFQLVQQQGAGDSQGSISQTSRITAYDIHHVEGFRVPYSLTIVDTPGYGDTKGLDRDQEIIEMIRKFFEDKNGIQQLDLVGFVAQASIARLTPTQMYIFDSVLSIFDNEVKNNIHFFLTFADSQVPPILSAIADANLPCSTDTKGIPNHYKFNNSGFFCSSRQSDDGPVDKFNKFFWEMGMENFEKCFNTLTKMEAISLLLTKQILAEKKRLEVQVDGLEPLIKAGSFKIEELRKTEQMVSNNENVEFELGVTVARKVEIRAGQYLTNCNKCNVTCHYPCASPNDDDKVDCAAMDFSRPATDRTCTVCPGKCLWNLHSNQPYRWEYVQEKQITSLDAIKEKYEKELERKLTAQDLVAVLKQDIEKNEKIVLEQVETVSSCIKKLEEIDALQPSPISSNMLACGQDMVRIKAMGHQFDIGTLYNYAKDTIIPNIYLWDPDDISNLLVISEKRGKNTVKVHSMANQQDVVLGLDGVTQTQQGTCWMSELEVDNHSAMSLTAGLMRPSSAGQAWHYVTDRINWTEGSLLDRGPEVAVYCRSSSKEISLNPASELDMVLRPEKLMESKATHVVVAITYGQGAFCVFTQNNSTADDNHQKSLTDFVRVFANRLVQNKSRLDPNKLIPNNLNCLLYSDLISAKSEDNWPVAMHYEACSKVLQHPANQAVPLEVWLYPISKLMPAHSSVSKMPANPTDISKHLVIRIQLLLDRWHRILVIHADSLVKEINNLERSTIENLNWLKPICEEVKNFERVLKKSLGLFMKALPGWIVSARRSADDDKLAGMIRSIENQSPFAYQEMAHWLHHQRQQIKLWKKLTKLPGVLHVSGATDWNNKELDNRDNDSLFAVILHLPSVVGQRRLAQEMNIYVDQFYPSLPSKWILWSRTEDDGGQITIDCNRILSVGRQFSDWVTDHNQDTTGVRYIICYNERPNRVGQIHPFMQLYNYDSERTTEFTIPRPPGRIMVADNRLGVITLNWTTEMRNDISSFLFQYRAADGPEEIWHSITHDANSITINNLQSAEKYLFRVAAVTDGGRSAFSPLSEIVTIDPVCPPPERLQSRNVTDSSITFTWDHRVDEDSNVVGDAQITISLNCYSIECWIDGQKESSLIQLMTKDKEVTIEPLDRDTVYCVQIRAVCTDAERSNIFNGPACPILRTRTKRDVERLAHIVKRASQKCSAPESTFGGIDIYQLPLKQEHRDGETPGIGHYAFGQRNYLALAGKRRQRTVLMLGATGSGKTTLINAMVNYILGVQWEDDFRFKLIDEPGKRSQTQSQTDHVTTYDVYQMKGSRLAYSLTVVDTPGFGDTRGIEKDNQIMDQIQDFFKSRHGIQQLEAVCFVVQSALARLTPSQQYIFDRILSIFGQDIKDNIRIMVTFADNHVPPVLAAVKEAGIPSPTDPITGLPSHHKFNNSVFFATNKDPEMNNIQQTYFDIAVTGFDQFFDDLSRMEATFLTLTREVLEERKRLEALVLEGLQMRTEIKLTRIDELEQMKKILNENKEQILEANEYFEFEVEFLIPKAINISGTGQFTTNCQKCRMTCHFPCRQASDGNKNKCSVMDVNGRCRVCSCPWNDHYHQKHRYEMVHPKKGCP